MASDPRSSGLVRKHMAFRMVITLLEVVLNALKAENSAIRLTENLPSNGIRREHARALVSLATVLVRNHEIIAVATSTSDVSWDRGKPGEAPTYIVAVNPRTSTRKTNDEDALTYRGETTVLYPPCDIDVHDPISYLKMTWASQHFQTHAAAILSFLNMSGQDQLGIFAYVAGKCYPKMLRRIQHRTYSATFVRGLMNIRSSQVNASHPFPQPHPINSRLGQCDAAFIESLSHPINDVFLKLSKINIPNLMALTQNYQVGSDLPFIYTSETCREFHTLLCHLLRSYEASLLMLKSYGTESLARNEMKDFEFTVHGVATCALVLWNLAYSSFLDEHLSRICLPNPRQSYQQEGSERGEEKEGEMEGEGEPEELDTDLIGVQPQTVLPGNTLLSLTNAYAAWLRLQVVYFEAINTLLGISRRFDGQALSVGVIAMEHPETTMVPWEELIEELMADSNDPLIAQASIDAISRIIKGSGSLKYKGTEHCELTVAVNALGKDNDFNTIIAVSKWCCPICSYVLPLVGPSIYVLGSHPIVSACSLPLSLPEPIVDKALTFFRAELRENIVKLVHSPLPITAQSRQRSDSANSHPISLTSNKASRSVATFLSNLNAGLRKGNAQSVDQLPQVKSWTSKMESFFLKLKAAQSRD